MGHCRLSMYKIFYIMLPIIIQPTLYSVCELLTQRIFLCELKSLIKNSVPFLFKTMTEFSPI